MHCILHMQEWAIAEQKEMEKHKHSKPTEGMYIGILYHMLRVLNPDNLADS